MSGLLIKMHKCGELMVIWFRNGLRLKGYLMQHGIKGTVKRLWEFYNNQVNYASWILKNEPSVDCYEEIRKNCECWNLKPIISILMPTFNSNLEYLELAISSVRNQTYPYWQLCIADDASSNPEILRYLKKLSKEDPRIIVTFSDVNEHISAASNRALKTATGDWVALLDHDDMLNPLALNHIVSALQIRLDANIIYSDEDKISTTGKRYAPYFKGGFNRELMWSQNAISHLGCYRRSLVVDLGGFRVGFEGSQDYDLALRVIERSRVDQIIHVPRVLYHWRAIPGSTAMAANEKDYASPAARKALREHLQRIGISAIVVPAPCISNMNRVKIDITKQRPTVSVLISTQERPDLLDRCISTIQNDSDSIDLEIIVLENTSPTNLSVMQNIAANRASGEYLCMLSSNVETASQKSLQEMLSFAQLREVGAVGARLVHSGREGRVKHVGLVLELAGIVGYAHAGLEVDRAGYFGRAVLHQRVTAVTQRCMVINKDRFLSVGGFDESLFGELGDLDLCLRLRRAGFHSIFTPYAEFRLNSEPQQTQGNLKTNSTNAERALDLMRARWGDELKNDPYYSVNLSLKHCDYRVSSSSRARSL